MHLHVGRRPICLPQHQCAAEDVRHAVERINPPFVVIGNTFGGGGEATQGRFAVRRRVFFSAEDVRVECENEGELGLACKLVAEDHNKWQEGDGQTRACVDETLGMEQEAIRRIEEGKDEVSEDEAVSEEDISLEEWSQMGYKWFRRDDVVYI